MYFKALMLSGCVALAGCQSAQSCRAGARHKLNKLISLLAGLQFAPMKLLFKLGKFSM